MRILDRALGLWRSRERPRTALALAGGGVIGGMYEVGALAALEARLGPGHGFDVYVGCSAGSVVASCLANGVSATELYGILEQDLDDPLNFRRGAVFESDSFRQACGRFGRLLWAIGKHAMSRDRCLPDVLARAERDIPAGFFSLAALERHLRTAFAARELSNGFAELPRPLLIPAIDLEAAQRVVFGDGDLKGVPISEAVAASSAIPGFFDPYTVAGRDYIDGGVGFTGHADLAAESGASVVLVVNPLVPRQSNGGASLRARGLYSIVEQANRITSQKLLQLGLAALCTRFPRTAFHLLQPPATSEPLGGPSMGFDASQAALRFGYTSTAEWLDRDGAALVRRLVISSQAAAV